MGYPNANFEKRNSYDIPQYIRDQAGGPNARILVMQILKESMPGFPIVEGFDAEGDNRLPLILVGRVNFPDMYAGDPRGLNSESISIDCFATGPNREGDSEVIAEAAVMNVMRAWQAGYAPPGLGSLSHVRRMDGPVIGDDWGPTLGPVQYADSPSFVSRARVIIVVKHRKPTNLKGQ